MHVVRVQKSPQRKTKPGEEAPKQKGGQKTKSVDPDERKESPDSESNPRTERQKKTWGIYTRLEPTLAVRSEPARGRQSPTTWPRIRRCGSLKPAQPCHVELVPAYNLANPHRGSSFPPFCYSHRSPETQPSGARGAKCYLSIKSTYVRSTASTTSPQARD